MSTSLYLFGPPRLEKDGEPLQLGSRKALALLSYLAVEDQPHARDRLAGLLWPESDQNLARGSLRRTLHLIGRFSEAVVSAGDTLCLDEDRLDVDLRRFRQTRQVELCRDEFMAGFALPDCPEFEAWIRDVRERLRHDTVALLDRLSTCEDPAEALSYARHRLALDPLDEAGHRRVIELLVRSGQRTAALRQYEECAGLVGRELGTEPEPETRRLVEKLLGHQSRPETKYVARDGVHIAYQVWGEPRPDTPEVVILNGFVSHLELFWEEPHLASFMERLGAVTRVASFDKRGVGLSDRVGRPPTLEDTMDDLMAVMDAAGMKRAVLFGVSEGGPNSVLVAATYPDRVQGLILYGTMAKGSRTPDHPWALTEAQHAHFLDRLVASWGKPFNLEYFAPTLAREPGFRDWWARMLRSASSPGGVRAVLQVLSQLDVRDILPAVQVPTLVLHRVDDRAILVQAGRVVAAGIPGARMVELPGRDHWWWVGDSQAILDEIRSFLEQVGSGESPPPERVLATVVCSDGPVSEGRCRVLPDGQTGLFDGPSRALEFARSQAAGGRRVGVHAGECVLHGPEESLPVRVARELVARATPGEALVTSTVRELVIGSPLSFASYGELELAGVSGWRVLALS